MTLRKAVRGRPESTYALRVSGWVESNTYTRVQGEWVDKGQSIHKMAYSSSRPTVLQAEGKCRQNVTK